MLALAGCRTTPPVIEPETSRASFATEVRPGTPALWDEVHAASVADGRARCGILDHGDEALALRVNLIRGARESIRIQAFIWKRSESARLLAWELLRAARQRGVRVQILVDQYYSTIEDTAVEWLAAMDPNVEIRVWNPVANLMHASGSDVVLAAISDLEAINHRMHNKLMVVDERIAITGGRNIANEYFDRVIGLNFLDRDVVWTGPGVTDAARSFDEYWDSPRVVPITDLCDIPSLREDPEEFPTDRAAFRLNHLFDELDAEADDPAWVRRTFVDGLRTVEHVEWVADDPDKGRATTPKNELSRTTAALVALIDDGRESILMQSPYLVLGNGAIRLFREFHAERPEVTIVVSTNSLAATDAWPVYGGSHRQKRVLIQDLGFRIHELRPIPRDIAEMMTYAPLLERKATPAEAADLRIQPFTVRDRARFNEHTGTAPFLSLHSKSLVVDGRVSFVGSFNLEPRSVTFNTEGGLIIHDEAFAAELAATIRRDLDPANAWLVGPRANPAPLAAVSDPFHRLFEGFVVDPWPVRYATCFELREGAEPVPLGDENFYRCWRDVGSFPTANLDKTVRAELFKTFGLVLHPYL
ncbi:MAG: phospholipase D-like domain-containing protein [Planctomycetota bacterium]